MNGYKMLFLSLLFIFTKGLEDQSFLGTQIIGSQCSNPSVVNTFTVTGFTASPWPPTSGSTIACVMTGTFTNSVTVSSLTYSISNKSTLFFYYNQIHLQQQTYSKGQTATLQFNVQVPPLPSASSSGNYRINLELVTSKNVKIVCWGIPF